MDIQEAKTIRLADYLQSIGYSPVKQQGSSLWYKSPFRQETEASFKVNTELTNGLTSGLAKAAISLHWQRNSIRMITYLPCWNASNGRRRIFIPHHFLFVSNHPSRVSNSWVCKNLHTQHYSDTCRNVPLMWQWLRANVKNCTLPITANLILLSVLKM